jgi:DNA repair protein RadC
MTKVQESWPGELPPREKLLQQGAKGLTDQELLAIYLRTGCQGMHVMALAKNLLEKFGSLHQLLMADFDSMAGIKGMGVAKFAQLVAVSELSRRSYLRHLNAENAMLSPEVMREYLQNLLVFREREVFLVLFLDNQHRVIRHEEMFAGTIGHVEVVSPRNCSRCDEG